MTKKHLLVVTGLFLFLYACNGSGTNEEKETAAEPTPEKNEAPSVDLGAVTYKAQCRLCHGDDGKLGASGSKDLQVSTLSHQDAINLVTYGRGGMMAYKDLLTKDEIENVVSYIETLRKK